jgi:hypothetical protein
MNKKVVLPALVLGVLAVGAFLGGQQAFADYNDGNNTIVQMLAERFGVEESEVEAVFDEHRTVRMQERQQEMEGRLEDAVNEGLLTSEQKDALLQKMEEWHSEKPDFGSMTREEHREAMESHRDEMQQWAEDNGIDLSVIHMGRDGFGGRGGMHKGQFAE